MNDKKHRRNAMFLLPQTHNFIHNHRLVQTPCDFTITKQVCPKILDKPVLFDKLNISNLKYPWAKIFLALHKK